MIRMKQAIRLYLLLLVQVGLITPSLCAQPFKALYQAPRTVVQIKGKNIPGKARISVDSARLSTQLERRVGRTYMQAHAAQTKMHLEHASPFFLTRVEKPLLEMTPLLEANVYPSLNNLLTTRKQVTDYFLVQNNLKIAQVTRLFKQNFERLEQAIPLLISHQRFIPAYLRDNMFWAACQFDSDLDYLLIGEVHNHPKLEDQIAEFIDRATLRFANRKIILFTEFLAETDRISSLDQLQQKAEEWPGPNFGTHLPVFKEALSHSITLVGLEPNYVLRRHNMTKEIDKQPHNSVWARYKNAIQSPDSIWVTPEGLYLRNQHWMQILKNWRKAFPSALFIIYAGDDHLNANFPYSLGHELKQQSNTFIASFYPGKAAAPAMEQLKNQGILYQDNLNAKQLDWLNHLTLGEGEFLPVSDFDIATQGKFPQGMLLFGPDDYKITGFDMQIKVKL